MSSDVVRRYASLGVIPQHDAERKWRLAKKQASSAGNRCDWPVVIAHFKESLGLSAKDGNSVFFGGVASEVVTEGPHHCVIQVSDLSQLPTSIREAATMTKGLITVAQSQISNTAEGSLKLSEDSDEMPIDAQLSAEDKELIESVWSGLTVDESCRDEAFSKILRLEFGLAHVPESLLQNVKKTSLTEHFQDIRPSDDRQQVTPKDALDDSDWAVVFEQDAPTTSKDNPLPVPVYAELKDDSPSDENHEQVDAIASGLATQESANYLKSFGFHRKK